MSGPDPRTCPPLPLLKKFTYIEKKMTSVGHADKRFGSEHTRFISVVSTRPIFEQAKSICLRFVLWNFCEAELTISFPRVANVVI